MSDKEEIKILAELETKGELVRRYKNQFRQMCSRNKLIKSSTVL